MIQFTESSSASTTFWILCLLCSIVHAVSAESPSSDLFDTSQSGLSSLNLDPTNLDFWNGENDLQFQSQSIDFADGFAGTTSASAVEPGSSDLFDPTTTFSAVGNDDPYLASSYVDGDAAFPESEIAQIAVIGASCEVDAREWESESSVDFEKIIFPRDHRDFGDIVDFGDHGCPLGKEAACCATGRPERVHNSIRMRPGCITWGENFFFEDLQMKNRDLENSSIAN